MATTTPNLGLRKPTANDNVNVEIDISANMDLLDAHAHSGTYVPSDPTLVLTYNADGTLASVTEAGIETTFTYNTDGTIATSTRLGVVRTYTYSGGNLTGVA